MPPWMSGQSELMSSDWPCVPVDGQRGSDIAGQSGLASVSTGCCFEHGFKQLPGFTTALLLIPHVQWFSVLPCADTSCRYGIKALNFSRADIVARLMSQHPVADGERPLPPDFRDFLKCCLQVVLCVAVSCW